MALIISKNLYRHLDCLQWQIDNPVNISISKNDKAWMNTKKNEILLRLK